MSIEEFNVKEQWLGTGLLSEYTFDFTIQDPSHLLLILQNAAGDEVTRFRGDDRTYLSGIVFYPKDGGGIVTLLNPLTDQYVITALLAPDAPTQPSEFKGKFAMTLELFEYALDRIVCQVQRLAYLAARSMKLSDLDDVTAFDMTLPPKITTKAGATIVVNPNGNGLAYGATLGDISGAQGYATQAIAAKDAALIAQAAAAASAAAAAASAAAASCSVLVQGTVAVPLDITAAGGITPTTGQEELQFVHGFPAAVIVTANPQIAAGAVIGKKLTLVGVDDAATLKLTNGNGLILNGDIILGNGDSIGLFWDGTNWREQYGRVR